MPTIQAPKRYTAALKTKMCQAIAERLDFDKTLLKNNDVLFENFYSLQNEIIPVEYRCSQAAWVNNYEWVMEGVKTAKRPKEVPAVVNATAIKRIDALEEAVSKLMQATSTAGNVDRMTLDECLKKVDLLVERVNRLSTIRDHYEKQCQTLTTIEAMNQRQSIAMEQQAAELRRMGELCVNQQLIIEEQQSQMLSLKTTIDHLMSELGLNPDGTVPVLAPPASTGSIEQKVADVVPIKAAVKVSEEPVTTTSPKKAKAEAITKPQVVIIGIHGSTVRDLKASHGEMFDLTFIDNTMKPPRVADMCSGKPTIAIFGGASGGVLSAAKTVASPYIHLSHGAGASTVKKALDTLFNQLAGEMQQAAATKKKSS